MEDFDVQVRAIEISTTLPHETVVTVKAKDRSEANWKALEKAEELYPASRFRNHEAY